MTQTEALEQGVPEWAVKHYLKCRSEGTSHSLALMFATRRAPLTKGTDSVFMAGMEYRQAEEFNNGVPTAPTLYRRVAKQAGVSTKGKVYKSSLALYPGDPRAWVDGLGDVKKLADERGCDVDGAVTVRAAKKRPWDRKDYRVADSIVDRLAKEAVVRDPSLKEKPKEEVREMVREKATPDWAK
jgi:hypothetical protein